MTSLVKVEELIIELIQKVDTLLKLGLEPDNIQNAIAAKIIKEISDKIDECKCNQEILDFLKNPEKKVIRRDDAESFKGKYSYPNFHVGNAELGSSGNPKALSWPFGQTQKPE